MAKFTFGNAQGATETEVGDATISGTTATAPDGIGVRIDTAFGAHTRSTGIAGPGPFPVFGFSQGAWESYNAALFDEGDFSIINLTPGASYDIKIAGQITNTARITRYIFPSGNLDYFPNDGTTAPPEPVTTTEVADANGEIFVNVTKAPNGEFHGYVTLLSVEPASVTPTITNINTTNEIIPGTTATITGTALTNTTGVTIGGEAQTGVTVVSDTEVTFTVVRGGNPYNQDLTAELTSTDGTVTQTVQQVPASGTFVVTAASANTTDDASLWTGLVDTVTGDPITIVNGDQALVKNPNSLGNLAVAADGTVTADDTGDFVVQIWLASEGVWGSDQTVSFEVPDNTPTPSPGGSAIAGIRRPMRAKMGRQSLRTKL